MQAAHKVGGQKLGASEEDEQYNEQEAVNEAARSWGWLQSWRAELTEAEHLKELNRKQSMGTRLAEGGPEVQRMESSSQWEERSSGETSISLSSQLVNSYEVSELFDRTW